MKSVGSPPGRPCGSRCQVEGGLRHGAQLALQAVGIGAIGELHRSGFGERIGANGRRLGPQNPRLTELQGGNDSFVFRRHLDRRMNALQADEQDMRAQFVSKFFLFFICARFRLGTNYPNSFICCHF